MLRPLATSITVKTKYGTDLTLTHEAWVIVIGHELVETRRQRGVLVGGTTFVAFDGEPIEGARIEGQDLAALLAPNEAGKRAGVFRIDDVTAKHDEILARDRGRLDAELKRRAEDRAKAEADDAAVAARLGLPH